MIRATIHLPLPNEPRLLCVEFSGTYRSTPEGAHDASYMTATLREGARCWQPMGLIVDLSRLEYEAGDDLETVLQYGHETALRTAFVVSPACAQGIAALIFGINTCQRAHDHDEFFETLEGAREYALRR